jgi:hypothetical protein
MNKCPTTILTAQIPPTSTQLKTKNPKNRYWDLGFVLNLHFTHSALRFLYPNNLEQYLLHWQLHRLMLL